MSESARSLLTDSQRSALAGAIDRPIVLVGLMGTGKSTIGRRLAAALGLPFVDADSEIERAAGCTISDFFAEYGEAAFREGERKVIARLLDDKPKVLATGGGAFVNGETRALILEAGLAIWLDADIEVLMERTARRDTRPLLRQGNPREILTRLSEERRPYYAQAPIHVRSNAGPHVRVVRATLKQLSDHLGIPLEPSA